MRVAVAALVAAMLFAAPGVARADEQSEETPSGLCVMAWVEVLGFGPVGLTNWVCLTSCSSVVSAGPLGPDVAPILYWDVGAHVPDPFNPNIFCLIS
ncbi:MAG: hypothetical protein KY469_16000 [Actinobacteria bacterium]|nr:hypothetical protein [Actinomycetota bacterium]